MITTGDKKFGVTKITDKSGNTKSYIGKSLPSQAILDACKTIEEVKLAEKVLKEIQNFKKINNGGDVIKHLQESGLSLPVVSAIINSMDNSYFNEKLRTTEIDKKEDLFKGFLKATDDKTVGALAASQFSEQFEDRAAESYHKSPTVVAERKVQFVRDIQTFFKEFKEKYLLAYLDDIQTMNTEEAVEYIRPKLNVLVDSVSEQFENQYRLKYIGKTANEQDVIFKEKQERALIIVDALTVMFGETLLEKNTQLRDEIENLDKTSDKSTSKAVEFINKAKHAKKRIDKTVDANVALSGEIFKKQESAIADGVNLGDGKKSPTAAEVADTTMVHETSVNHEKVTRAFNEASKNLENLMRKIETAVKSDSKLKVDMSDFEKAHDLLIRIHKARKVKKLTDEQLVEATTQINALIENISTNNPEALKTIASIEAASPQREA